MATTLADTATPTAAAIVDESANMSRTSRLSEAPTEVYIAEDQESVYEAALHAQRDRCHLRTWMRVFNAIVHITACILLLVNMTGFLAEFQGTYFKYMT